MIKALLIIFSLLVLIVTVVGLYMSIQPTTCRHGTLAHANCRLCKREMDEWYAEEMKAFNEQHSRR